VSSSAHAPPSATRSPSFTALAFAPSATRIASAPLPSESSTNHTYGDSGTPASAATAIAGPITPNTTPC
jgi:hypothetical protein